MVAIWKREVQNYLLTPIGYVFMGIFLLVGGIYFFLYNVMSGSNDLSGTFSAMSYIFMVLVPILTMRLLSEDRRNKTDQLLLTSPISITGMVLGKFLAACSILFICIVGMGFYAMVIAQYAQRGQEVYWGLIFTNYLGFFLLGCSYIAIGVLMSALTENQVSAAVLTFGVNLFLQIMEMVSPQLNIPFISVAFSWMSLYSRYFTFSAGILSFADIVYYLSFCGVFLFLAVRVIDKRRWSEG